MKVLISGASGLVGTELVRQLKARGDTPVRLVRRKASSPEEIEWNPATGELPEDTLVGIDAVVNLAGATISKLPWTAGYKRKIIESRLQSTQTLVRAINVAKDKPRVLISGTASGFYGDTGDALIDESAANGSGFLAELAGKWEAEAAKVDASVRLVLVRTTIVMSRRLGALSRLLPLIKLGIGGALGSGKQWWAWISVVDEAGAIMHLIDHADASGPFNLTAPEAATCGEIVKSLGRKLHRPTIIPVPAFALKLLLGEAADELLLCSQKLSAQKLLDTGYKFAHPTLDSATAWVVAKD